MERKNEGTEEKTMWEKDGVRGGEREGIREIVRKGETERGRGRGRQLFEHVLLGESERE